MRVPAVKYWITGTEPKETPDGTKLSRKYRTTDGRYFEIVAFVSPDMRLDRGMFDRDMLNRRDSFCAEHGIDPATLTEMT